MLLHVIHVTVKSGLEPVFQAIAMAGQIHVGDARSAEPEIPGPGLDVACQFIPVNLLHWHIIELCEQRN